MRVTQWKDYIVALNGILQECEVNEMTVERRIVLKTVRNYIKQIRMFKSVNDTQAKIIIESQLIGSIMTACELRVITCAECNKIIERVHIIAHK